MRLLVSGLILIVYGTFGASPEGLRPAPALLPPLITNHRDFRQASRPTALYRAPTAPGFRASRQGHQATPRSECR
nr:MAG TPA: hypothetical protein [Bacteriophage sp.]